MPNECFKGQGHDAICKSSTEKFPLEEEKIKWRYGGEKRGRQSGIEFYTCKYEIVYP